MNTYKITFDNPQTRDKTIQADGYEHKQERDRTFVEFYKKSSKGSKSSEAIFVKEESVLSIETFPSYEIEEK